MGIKQLKPGVCSYTPIVVDVGGNGFSFTDAAGGVSFDMSGRGARVQTAWTAPGSDDAWLTLDRNGNGKIDNGAELFGSATEQPSPLQGEKRNGFLALAEYDKAANGGNRDDQITKGSRIIIRAIKKVNSSNCSKRRMFKSAALASGTSVAAIVRTWNTQSHQV